MKKEREEILSQEISFLENDFKIVFRKKQSGASGRAFHEAIEVKYCFEGRMMQMIDNDIIISETGDITITNPYELHTNTETEQYNGWYYLLNIDPDFFVEADPMGIDLRDLLIAKGLKFNNHIRNHKRLQEILLQVAKEMEEKREYHRLVVYHLLSEFFILLLRDEVNSEESGARSKEGLKRARLIAPALSKIFKDYQQHITIDELAALCNISKYHFCRLFKEETGVTAIQYITRYRISLAEALLRDENKSMSEVAYQCGFEDISYFYRCYKKIKGVPPKKDAHM